MCHAMTSMDPDGFPIDGGLIQVQRQIDMVLGAGDVDRLQAQLF